MYLCLPRTPLPPVSELGAKALNGCICDFSKEVKRAIKGTDAFSGAVYREVTPVSFSLPGRSFP